MYFTYIRARKNKPIILSYYILYFHCLKLNRDSSSLPFEGIWTGFPGEGVACAYQEGADGTVFRTRGTLTSQVVDWVELRLVEKKTLLMALFWSMVLAQLYHTLRSLSAGLPDTMVATAFWIWGLRPRRNLTTAIFGSV